MILTREVNCMPSQYLNELSNLLISKTKASHIVFPDCVLYVDYSPALMLDFDVNIHVTRLQRFSKKIWTYYLHTH
jgi:hypothetical protein